MKKPTSANDQYYYLKRDNAGCHCTFSGKEIPIRDDLWNHSPTGFGWGYGGSGPAQLALALLAHAVGPKTAMFLHQSFKREIIARIVEDEGIMRQWFVREWVKGKLDEMAEIIDQKAIEELLREFARGGK